MLPIVFIALALAPSSALPHLFLSLDDAHDTWGVLTAVPPRLSPVPNSTGIGPPPILDGQRILATYENGGGYECFVVHELADEHVRLLLFESRDLKQWGHGTEVLRVPPDTGSLSLKTLARRPPPQTLYTLLAFGYNKTLAEHFNSAYGWTSVDGRLWKPINTLEPLPFAFGDHDDSMAIWHGPSQRFVDMQITYEYVAAKTVFGSTVADRVADNVCTLAPGGRCVRRVISARTSLDGRNWSADLEPYRTPDALDPPELEFYRFRPFFIGTSGRMAASVLLYAPSPAYAAVLLPKMCRSDCKMCCHAPHMYSEVFVLRDGADPTDLAAWLRPHRHTSMRGLIGPWTPTDVLLDTEPLVVGAPTFPTPHLLWLTRALTYDPEAPGAVALTLPVHRLGGLTAPANAAFSTAAFKWPATGAIALDADVSWQVAPGATHCDQGCQAYVLVELLNAATGAPLRGFERDKCIVRNVSGTQLPLRWVGALPSAKGPAAGTPVVARIFLRAAVVHALVEA